MPREVPRATLRAMGSFTHGGVEYRARDGAVQQRTKGERRWQPCSRQSLLAFAVDSPVWQWLRSEGITRPSPSGATQPEAERDTVQVKLRLARPDDERLEEIAKSEKSTKSAVVTRWIRQHK